MAGKYEFEIMSGTASFMIFSGAFWRVGKGAHAATFPHGQNRARAVPTRRT